VAGLWVSHLLACQVTAPGGDAPLFPHVRSIVAYRQSIFQTNGDCDSNDDDDVIDDDDDFVLERDGIVQLLRMSLAD